MLRRRNPLGTRRAARVPRLPNAGPQRAPYEQVLALRPGVLESHRPVVDRLSRSMVAQIGDEVPVTLELENLPRLRRAERRLDVCPDHALAVGIQIVEPVALGGFHAVVIVVVTADDR